MKKIITSFYCIFFLIQFCYSQNNKKKESQELYKLFIENLIFSTEEWSDQTVLGAIPTSENEFSIFFSLDYGTEEKVKLFRLLNEEIQARSYSNKKILKSYLEMSKYVDGYYAETYFDYVSYLASSKTEYFCNIFFELDELKRNRIEAYFQLNCEN